MRGATVLNKEIFAQGTISIHAPHAGRDRLRRLPLTHEILFQSTRPMRGATTAEHRPSTSQSYFNPRAPCGARRFRLANAIKHLLFQSTRPMRGATPMQQPMAQPVQQFQSTRPMRGATFAKSTSWPRFDISIHAPHAGRDYATLGVRRTAPISIHAPHAGRD